MFDAINSILDKMEIGKMECVYTGHKAELFLRTASFNLDNKTLAESLNIILEPYGLIYIVKGGKILIFDKDKKRNDLNLSPVSVITIRGTGTGSGQAPVPQGSTPGWGK